ncbi:unnamed protein product, partial [Ectocarpus sp. 4 AP-2014]
RHRLFPLGFRKTAPSDQQKKVVSQRTVWGSHTVQHGLLLPMHPQRGDRRDREA